MEICELADHPWYLGCQFHPEFKSKPLEPHPLFRAFIGAASYEESPERTPDAECSEPECGAGSETVARVRDCSFDSVCRSGRGAGADRRPLRDRERRARAFSGARDSRTSSGAFIFKASFDKANRYQRATPIAGPGLREGLRILESACETRDFRSSPISTSRRKPRLRRKWSTFCRFPAFLCRQTDLLLRRRPHRARSSILRRASSSRRTIFGARRKRSRRRGTIEILLTERG